MSRIPYSVLEEQRKNSKLSDSSQALTIGFCHESNEVNLAIVGRAVT